jgi:hypothetical protein
VPTWPDHMGEPKWLIVVLANVGNSSASAFLLDLILY